MSFADGKGQIDPTTRVEIAGWLIDAREHLTPASTKEIALVINGLFEAYDLPPPSKYALAHWFEALSTLPLWALEKGARDTIAESPHKPTIADLLKRAIAYVAPHSTAITKARMLLDYGTAPEPETEVTPEQRRRVAEIVARAFCRMDTDPEDEE